MSNKLILAIVTALVLIGGVWYFMRTSVPAGVRQSAAINLKNGDTYTLTASYVTKELAGTKQKMLAYNGTIPGPEIHVPQGAEITINFKNETDMSALLHAHGVRMDNAYDGSQLQQKDVPPGGSYVYKLKFPDAGVFWYHPHANEVYGQALGLYGAFMVKSTDANYYPPVNSEHVLFLSDLLVAHGAIALEENDTHHMLMGHFGNMMLVNGQENYIFTAKTGEVVQLAVINAAIARPYNFAIAGAKLKLIGGDNGAYERATWQDSVILGPSERAIVDVMFEKAGTYEMQNRTPDKTYTLGHIVVSSDLAQPAYATSFSALQENKTVTTSIAPLRQYFDNAPDKRLTLSIDLAGMMMGHMQSMGGMGGVHGMSAGAADGIEWNDSNQMMQMMNNMATAGETTWKITDAATGKSNMDIDWTFRKGQPVKIEIYNDPNSMHPMQHPIHFHGQRFLVLSINGVRQTNLVWKDTVLVPAGAKIDILLDQSNPGVWMAHCHISEHLVAGMMFTYRVE